MNYPKKHYGYYSRYTEMKLFMTSKGNYKSRKAMLNAWQIMARRYNDIDCYTGNPCFECTKLDCENCANPEK